jgi:MraZ protein
MGSSRLFQPGSTTFTAHLHMALFRGVYDNNLDAKNRLTIPAKLRNQLVDGVVVALPRDATHCIAIWSTAEFDAHAARLLEGVHPLSDDYATLERFLHAYSNDVELDGAGRVMLPSHLIDVAGLGREVSVIGAGNRLEVWDRETWREQGPHVRAGAKEVGPGSRDGHTA